MLTVVIISLACFALLLMLGSWRVRLRKASYERPVRSAWAALPEGVKGRLMGSASFREGLAGAGCPTTLRRLRRDDPPDAVFDAYLRELKVTDKNATSAEWQAAMAQIQRWLVTGV